MKKLQSILQNENMVNVVKYTVFLILLIVSLILSKDGEVTFIYKNF